MEHNANHKESGRFLHVDMRWVVGGGMVASALILLLLLISLVTDYANSKQQLMRQLTDVPVSSEVKLEITYPQQLQLNAKPGKVVIGLRVGETAVFTPPLTITLDTPPSIAISGTVQGKHAFMEGNGAPVAFLLVNTAVLPLRQQQTITLTHSLTTTPTLLTIDVEAPQTAAWREFVLGTISDKSPLLLTTTILLSIAGLVAQQLNKQQENEERQINIEIKKFELQEKAEKRQAEQKLLLIENDIPLLRTLLIRSDKLGIQRTWSQFDLATLSRELPSTQNEWLSALVGLALDGVKPEDRLEEMWIQWPLESIGALLAAENSVMTRPQEFQRTFRLIPIEEVEDLKTRDLYIQLWHQIEPVPLQNADPEITLQPDAYQETLLEKTKLHDLINRDPLQSIFAENEEIALFDEDGFWYWHPAYEKIVQTTQLLLVCGPRGSGRTAIAKSLCYHESRYSGFFWHYQPVYTGINIVSLNRHLTHQLLSYVTAKPTLLLPVQENQRQLLAQVLIKGFGQQYILARLDSVRDQKKWSQNANSETQRQAWEKVGDTQLALMLESVLRISDKEAVSDHNWTKILIACFNLLGFRGIRLILDCAPDAITDVSNLLPTLQEWQSQSLITTLFAFVDDIPIPIEQVFGLSWTKEQLAKLFAHRLLRLADCSNPTLLFQDENTYNRFLKLVASEERVTQPPTPRKLAQLWQTILKTIGDNELIDIDTINLADDFLRQQDEQARNEGSREKIDLSQLRDLMDESFSEEELRTLCLDLSVDYDNLPGRNKKGRIQELVLLFRREGRLSELLERCQQLRPKIP